ncbi:hypothetical protein [Aquabacterium sp. J223]|uniref:hypothetical protein n=1 Tax=Aquabacterium sp. J223 TaxID=2898431 RepID=UPI0021ADFFD7|nr:hypothetical protein [Aquabacterium sp. J223]UUX94379.1 hypothetical protein LRS07_13745 [Aquabacterium sp. J223]
MTALAGLLAHAVAFTGLLALLRPVGVVPVAWVLVFGLGSAVLTWGPRHPIWPRSPAVWLKVFAVTVLVAAVFFGADVALTTLGNSVKPRVPPPEALGGLTLPLFLVPGVASVACGAWVGALVGRP